MLSAVIVSGAVPPLDTVPPADDSVIDTLTPNEPGPPNPVTFTAPPPDEISPLSRTDTPPLPAPTPPSVPSRSPAVQYSHSS